jgi:hypothetical protein
MVYSDTTKEFRGRKQRSGSICFSEQGRICVFVNYCPVCKSKVMIDFQEAEQFAKRFNNRQRHGVGEKLYKYLQKKYS